MNIIKKFGLLVLTIMVASACTDDNVNTSSSSGFDYRTIREYTVHIRTQNVSNQFLKNVYVELYTANPMNEAGLLIEKSSDLLIFKGMTNERGIMSCKISPATTVDSLYVLTRQIGLPSLSTIALKSELVEYTIGGASTPAAAPALAVPAKVVGPKIPKVDKTKDDKYYVLGTWKKDGLPKYLSDDDLVEQSLIDDINNSLPEQKDLKLTHPEYLTGTEDGKIKLTEDAEIWVTFVHEGAGYFNSLLYYTYPTGNAPDKVADITDPTIIFPNVSFTGSGGELSTGNKVQLFYLDPKTNEYTNVFPAGVTISWMLKSNAWRLRQVAEGYWDVFSDINLNPEPDNDLKKHVVLLRDDARELIIMGFEDMRRDRGADNDFNDAVFYATVTPYTAVDLSDLPEIDTDGGSGSGSGTGPTPDPDRDDDGVNDDLDEYPDDASKAFNNYYPSKNGTGTLAFEDLYPNRGDYDFNDMVIDYNFNQITNAANQVVELDMKLTLRAIGASFFNGFGFQFNTLPANIKSVVGQRITEDILNLSDNGTEANQSKAVIMVFDNAFSILQHPGQGSMGVNTTPGAIYVEPVELNLNVKLTSPVSVVDFGTPPYNPFIFVDKDRSREVHLPTYAPTDLADQSLFGTGDDDSDPETGKYYTSSKYHPWAINLPVRFDYPAEKEDITETYLYFNVWANSKGEKFDDWYIKNEGYRSVKKVYTEPVTEK